MSAAEKSKKSGKKHIVDVQKPGTATPSPTSKPVLVSNRPLLKDPMVVIDKADEDEAESSAPPKLSTTDKPKLQPLKPTLSEEPADEKAAQSDKPSLTKADTSPMDSARSSPGPSDALPTTQAPDSSEPAAQRAETEATAKTKHDAVVQQLVDSKKYVLPIQTAEQRNSKRVVILGALLSVVLLLVWVDIALDAGIIKLGGLQPVTRFFSN